MATNWNTILAGITTNADILAILRKILALLDGKVDLTKIDEIMRDLESMQIGVDTALNDVLSALVEFDSASQEALQQVIEAGLIEGFETEAELLASRPTVLKKYAKAEDTKVIWFWNKPDGAPDGNYWTSTGLSELDQAKQYADTRTQESINENIPQYSSKKHVHTWGVNKNQVMMYLASNGTLNIYGDIQTNAFKRIANVNLGHVLADKNGLVYQTIRPDGSIYFKKSVEERYLPQYSYRQYLELDKRKNANVEPFFIETVVAPYQTDGKLHQRMPASIKVGANKIFVAFSQFNTANEDSVNARLVGRFVTYDLAAKTITVDPNTVIMRDTGNTAIASRHPNLIKLKDGRYMCLFNETLIAGSAKSPLYAIYSDDCVTWSAPVIKLADNSDTFTFTISSTIQRIHTGKYKDRLIVPVYNSLWEVRLMYSDDEGETWKVGKKWNGAKFGDSTLQTNETSVVVDIDGSLIIHSRTEKNSIDNRFFYIAKSVDGGETIDSFGKNTEFAATNCAIGMVQAAQSFNDGIPKILASRPTSPNSFSRNHFMISASYDGLNSCQFNYKPFPDEVNVGYTHLLALDDENFVLAMEKGTEINNGNNYVSVAFFNMSEIINNG
ncbi:sialidase family protein [Acinetobacter baumannii]